MATRFIISTIIAIAASAALTRVILYNEWIRPWLINVPSLLTWGAAFLAGAIVALVAPRTFEVSIPAVGAFLGSLVGIIAFGTGMNISLADQGVLAYIGINALLSTLPVVVLASLGGWLVAALRDYQDQTSRPSGRRRGRPDLQGRSQSNNQDHGGRTRRY